MAEDLLCEEIKSALPVAVRDCLEEPRWWDDERRGPHVIKALTELALPPVCEGYRRVDNAASPRWDWQGHALVHESSVVHSGVNLFGPVLVGPSCEIGPNASIFGPTVVEGRSYIGPSVEVRRSLLLAGAEVSHMSFVGHSVIGRQVALGAFFCSAVRNLERGTVHVLHDGALVDTGERRLGCVIADGVETGVHTTVMPGRRVTDSTTTAAGSVIVKNC
jgi:UDP-N-acetylglucosamine diphosphorylase / glucose-1-phosphate thymidylyltransferase / UDP-N-acetylgalactosamine diphosphorylase / glucosamine-1-phosphate N-acetyltransferase / galactosamine-1-phosphate N-acetyltransferase